MEPRLVYWIFPILFVGSMALMLLAARSATRRATRNLRIFADRLGLTLIEYPPVLGYFPRTPTVEGHRRGKPVRLFTFNTGSGKSRKTWTALGVQARERSLSFSLQPQGLGTRILELFGAKEITVGDPAFDAAWFVRTNREDFLRIALIPELRARLMAARQAGLREDFRCENGEVRYAEVGGFSDEARVERFLLAADLCADLAEVAEAAAAARGGGGMTNDE
jgi:hypothetical protein